MFNLFLFSFYCNLIVGGLIVWECGCDFVEFIFGEGIDFRGKLVIEVRKDYNIFCYIYILYDN